MANDAVLRAQLVQLLQQGNAHMPFDQAVAGFPLDRINEQLPGLPYTPWRLLEHVRIAQWDILEFVRNPDHASPEWPEGYWPPEGVEADPLRWQETVQGIQADRQALVEIVQDPDTDLHAWLPQGEPYTVLREVLIVADHGAYHLGEFALLRQVMGAWPEE
jgi:hypothetical protein